MLLSIIIPNHNYAGYVDAAIRGAVDQADADVEIFVVDDGSTDRSWERIERYARYVDCARVELRNARLSALHAFRRSRGRYVMVLDADDMLRDGAIARIKQAIATGAALVQAPLDVVGPDNRSLGYRFPRMAPSIGREDAIASIEATGSYVSPPTSGLVFRRDVFELLDEVDYEPWVDGITYLAAPWFGDIHRLVEPISAYRVHDRNASAHRVLDVPTLVRERRRFLDRLTHLEAIAERRGRPLRYAVEPKDFTYVTERDLLIARFLGRPQEPGAYAAFMRSALREKPLHRVALFAGYVGAILALPDRWATPLLIRRRDHWKGYVGL